MVDYKELNTMCQWERQKAMYLIQTAERLGMSTEGYGMLAVNPNSGYTYLWLDDYEFTLYMPINCELQTSDVYALYSCPIDGEEEETELGNKTLAELEEWAQEQREKSDAKEAEGEEE